MYTSILGNKQSTINSYMYFFPFHIQKGFEGGAQTLEFYHHQISAGFGLARRRTEASQQRTHSDAKPEKKGKGEIMVSCCALGVPFF